MLTVEGEDFVCWSERLVDLVSFLEVPLAQEEFFSCGDGEHFVGMDADPVDALAMSF